MRILIAPDKFKGTLRAKDAATAIARGVRRAAEELGVVVDIEVCPVADGGEGTLEAVFDSGSSIQRVVVPVRDPDGLGVHDAEFLYWWNGKGYTALVEVAQAVSSRWVPRERRKPECLSTIGVGTLISHATYVQPSQILISLGGSATVDGGVGAMEALQHELGLTITHAESDDPDWPAWCESTVELNRDQSVWVFRARHLSSIRVGKRSNLRSPSRLPPVTALCDVSNPLLGPNGAARVFGPQKGATPEQVEKLEAGLANLVKVCRECGIPCDPDQPGAGSAGGLGFGLATFLGAKLVPGAPFIFDLLKFDERVAKVDLIITGEGRLDSQTVSGKAAAEVARRAARVGRPCLAVVGSTEGSAQQAREVLDRASITFDGVASAAEAAGSPQAALQQPAKWVQEAGYRAMSEFLSKARA